MFDTMKVAQKIREARIAQNMTQMALADEMGVSYQAVSNWERGNSMPDISKLEQLCNILRITVYELLGTDNDQARTVSKILNQKNLPEAEEIAEIAPIIPPEKIKVAASETAKKCHMNWNAIMKMAPFLDYETLDTLLENVEPRDYEKIKCLAPFLSNETLEKLVNGCSGEVDRDLIFALAPFLKTETLDALVMRYDGSVDKDMVMGLAAFLGSETMDRLITKNTGEIDSDMVKHLAPFLSTAAMDKLVDKLLETGDLDNLSGIYPFLSRNTMRKLVKKMMDRGDFDSMQKAAVFM